MHQTEKPRMFNGVQGTPVYAAGYRLTVADLAAVAIHICSAHRFVSTASELISSSHYTNTTLIIIIIIIIQ